MAGALAYVHSLGIIHADLGLHNLLLSEKGDVVLCDFAGSGIDDTRNRVAHGTRYSDPVHRYDATSQRHDVFALGTVMYELARGELLFEGLEDGEICGRLERREFPDLSDLPMPLRDVIMKCWMAPGYTARDALNELGAPLRSYLNSRETLTLIQRSDPCDGLGLRLSHRLWPCWRWPCGGYGRRHGRRGHGYRKVSVPRWGRVGSRLVLNEYGF